MAQFSGGRGRARDDQTAPRCGCEVPHNYFLILSKEDWTFFGTGVQR